MTREECIDRLLQLSVEVREQRILVQQNFSLTHYLESAAALLDDYSDLGHRLSVDPPTWEFLAFYLRAALSYE